MCSIAPSPSFAASQTSFVTPDTTPHKIADKPLTDHTNELRTVRNTNAKRRITFAADDDTPDPARQLWLDEKLLNLSAENEADAHESALAFFNATAAEFPESVEPVGPVQPLFNDELEIGEIARFDADNTKSAEVIEAPHDSPVRHCANSWREIDEDDEEANDEPCAKKAKAEHFVTCRNCERTYDGFAQCCPHMDPVREESEEPEGRYYVN